MEKKRDGLEFDKKCVKKKKEQTNSKNVIFPAS